MCNIPKNPLLKSGDKTPTPQILKPMKGVKVAYLTWEDDYDLFNDKNKSVHDHPELILTHPNVKIMDLHTYQQAMNTFYGRINAGLPENFDELICTRYFFTES